MKKFISLIALVGVFAACEPENLQTAYTVANATATINVTVVSAAPGFDEKAAQVTYAWSNGGTTETIEGNPSIAAGSVTVTATYAGSTATETLSFPQIFAGMNAHFTATLFIPYNSGDYTLSVKTDKTSQAIEVYGLQAAAHGHGYAKMQEVEVGGMKFNVKMMENASEFILEDSYTFETFKGIALAKSLSIKNDDFKDAATNVYNAFVKANITGIVPTKHEYGFAVGAWSLYNVVNPVITTTADMVIVAAAKDGSNNPMIPEVATFAIKMKSSLCTAVEKAHPDHASHYVPHSGNYTHDGHAIHGDNNNAGGGIITAE